MVKYITLVKKRKKKPAIAKIKRAHTKIMQKSSLMLVLYHELIMF